MALRRSQQLLFSLFIGVFLSLLLGIGTHIPEAIAHGAMIKITPSELALTARFETGEPMATAQVLIYSPQNLTQPWRKSQTDAKGTFSFVPDTQQHGQWEVIVRKAGHGHTTHFSVDENGTILAHTPTAASDAFVIQRRISIAAVLWGLIGTALFFARPSTNPDSQLQPAPAINLAHKPLSTEKVAEQEKSENQAPEKIPANHSRGDR